MKLCASFLLVLLVSACATFAQPVVVRQGVSELEVSRSKLLDETNSTLQYVNSNKDALYFQTDDGTGSDAFASFGAIVAAENMVAIDAVTQADAAQLMDKVPVDPAKAFTKAATGSSIRLAAGSAVKVSPYLYISKAEPEVLLLAAALIVEGSGPSEGLQNKYMYQIAGQYSPADLASLNDAAAAKLNKQIEDGYSQILKRIAADAKGSASLEKTINFKSPFLTPRFDYALTGTIVADDADVTWVRVAGGMFALQKESIIATVQALPVVAAAPAAEALPPPAPAAAPASVEPSPETVEAVPEIPAAVPAVRAAVTPTPAPAPARVAVKPAAPVVAVAPQATQANAKDGASLRATPALASAGGKIVAILAAGTPVILKQKISNGSGVWWNVSAAAKGEGWIRELELDQIKR
ncbi:hypothetical protein CJD38_10005 [Stenotrophobium rhamnosiphilum]|uniref:SH3b domain-containing protein n=2 Tax=Stenotrophobium rhamnosiphilum TaxID=2029166 RepID=A0A2T5MGF1_9GAMM|nr:hypothetical protein CJD38_10005 [Stenotrophobium rhamnosiphilum]